MSQNTPLITRIQPNTRMEKVVAVCALTMQVAPRTINRTPMRRNQTQDFLTSAIPAANTSENFVIVLLLSIWTALALATAVMLAAAGPRCHCKSLRASSCAVASRRHRASTKMGKLRSISIVRLGPQLA